LGIDQSQHYCDIAQKRIEDHVVNQPQIEKLFDYEP
jgi:hypothetical protein